MRETKMKTAPRSVAFVMRLAVLLLSLTCLTMGMVANLQARFVTQDNGSDAARAASFSYVISPGTPQALDLANLSPGDQKTVSFTISGQSEVAVRYTIEVLTIGNLPLA